MSVRINVSYVVTIFICSSLLISRKFIIIYFINWIFEIIFQPCFFFIIQEFEMCESRFFLVKKSSWNFMIYFSSYFQVHVFWLTEKIVQNFISFYFLSGSSQNLFAPFLSLISTLKYPLSCKILSFSLSFVLDGGFEFLWFYYEPNNNQNMPKPRGSCEIHTRFILIFYQNFANFLVTSKYQK